MTFLLFENGNQSKIAFKSTKYDCFYDATMHRRWLGKILSINTMINCSRIEFVQSQSFLGNQHDLRIPGYERDEFGRRVHFFSGKCRTNNSPKNTGEEMGKIL